MAVNQDISELARSVLKVSRNTLAIHLRFMDMAISRLRWVSIPEAVARNPALLPLVGTALATEGTAILYDPVALCKMYVSEKNSGPRAYLHLLLHGVFRHFYANANVDQNLWDLACDMAVEGVINDLNLPAVMTSGVPNQQAELKRIAPKVKNLLTAEKIYAYLRTNPPKDKEFARLKQLFSPDDHAIWYAKQQRSAVAAMAQDADNDDGNGEKQQKATGVGGGNQPNQTEDDGESQFDQIADSARTQAMMEEISKAWQTIAERMQTDLETFSKKQGDMAGGMMQNLLAVNREKYDYTSFLKKFAVMGEAMRINDDEFDYVFYTYGMNLFPEKRMPLIEPLEYKDMKRIREFVIAIDTSGSVQGKQVQAFLQKTYNILQSTESFFSRVNVHIIQCDADIQEDVKITSREEFDQYMKTMTIKGLGGTDFRPVFARVDEMIRDKEFANLKGLIYFTDGYGSFPERMPKYKTAFVFVEEGYEVPEVPVWAMKLVLTKEEMQEHC